MAFSLLTLTIEVGKILDIPSSLSFSLSLHINIYCCTEVQRRISSFKFYFWFLCFFFFLTELMLSCLQKVIWLCLIRVSKHSQDAATCFSQTFIVEL